MLRLPITALAAISVLAASAAAQNFDASGNGQLRGAYFVREVLIAGQNSAHNITQANSATGIVTFDGAGKYSFTGQVTSSTGGSNASTLNGQYELAANGLFHMTSLANPNDACVGAVSAIGPSAIVASATENGAADMLVAVPAGSGLNNGSLVGGYTAGYIDFTNAAVGQIREAQFNMTSNGSGSFGNVSATGAAENLGGSTVTQNVSGVSYSITGNGSGTVSFGAQSTNQLISGTKNLYMSADGNILIGGNPAGFDMVVAVRSLTGNASNATSKGLYFTGALEYFVDPDPQFGPSVNAFYGSANATGAGTTLNHHRLTYASFDALDYTFDTEYTVQPDGTINSNDTPNYKTTFGVGGKAFITTGTQGQYSLTIGFAAPTYTGTGVYINPTAVVSAASFAPITNPIAPGEIVTLFGSGLATATVPAASVPLQTTLGGVQVTVNGTPAPLFFVSSGQISFLVPTSINPQNTLYATVQVTNNNVKSNPVTVYFEYTAPGIFSLNGSGVADAAATHPNAAIISQGNPIAVGEVAVIYAGGLGLTDPVVPSGDPSPSNPLAKIQDRHTENGVEIYDQDVDFAGQPLITTGGYMGLVPGLSGLYQINGKVDTGTPSGNDYVNIRTPDAYTSQTTVWVSGSSSTRAVKPHAEATRPRSANLARTGARAKARSRAGRFTQPE